MNQNEFRTGNSCEHSENRWSALDSRSDHPLAEFCDHRRGGIEQEGKTRECGVPTIRRASIYQGLM